MEPTSNARARKAIRPFRLSGLECGSPGRLEPRAIRGRGGAARFSAPVRRGLAGGKNDRDPDPAANCVPLRNRAGDGSRHLQRRARIAAAPAPRHRRSEALQHGASRPSCGLAESLRASSARRTVQAHGPRQRASNSEGRSTPSAPAPSSGDPTGRKPRPRRGSLLVARAKSDRPTAPDIAVPVRKHGAGRVSRGRPQRCAVREDQRAADPSSAEITLRSSTRGRR